MAISLNSSSESAFGEAVSSTTFSHTVVNGISVVLVVGSITRDATDSDRPVTGITYNAIALTKARAEIFDSSDITSEQWYRANPTVGAANIVITYTGNISQGAYGVGSAFNGVDTSSPIEANTGTSAISTTPATVNITTLTPG